jgi:hypothetical protein
MTHGRFSFWRRQGGFSDAASGLKTDAGGRAMAASAGRFTIAVRKSGRTPHTQILLDNLSRCGLPTFDFTEKTPLGCWKSWVGQVFKRAPKRDKFSNLASAIFGSAKAGVSQSKSVIGSGFFRLWQGISGWDNYPINLHKREPWSSPTAGHFI